MRLMRLIHRDGRALADDLEAGKIVNEAVAARIDSSTLKALNAQLGGPNPTRADEIRAALASSPRFTSRRSSPLENATVHVRSRVLM